MSLDTLHDLMEELAEDVPEIKNKYQLVAAKIKTHVHNDKYGVWYRINQDLVPRRDRGWRRYLYKAPGGFINIILHWCGLIKFSHLEPYFESLRDYADAKLKTHNNENWGKLETNIEWCNKYVNLTPPKQDKETRDE